MEDDVFSRETRFGPGWLILYLKHLVVVRVLGEEHLPPAGLVLSVRGGPLVRGAELAHITGNRKRILHHRIHLTLVNLVETQLHKCDPGEIGRHDSGSGASKPGLYVSGEGVHPGRLRHDEEIHFPLLLGEHATPLAQQLSQVLLLIEHELRVRDHVPPALRLGLGGCEMLKGVILHGTLLGGEGGLGRPSALHLALLAGEGSGNLEGRGHAHCLLCHALLLEGATGRSASARGAVQHDALSCDGLGSHFV
mmetsp:Transcript_18365/g.40139  ORF Transcript_18365/g.40139 Transcript_18365/m.40139 type:complete len:251 (-) Transcript_18365:72-824(-)